MQQGIGLSRQWLTFLVNITLIIISAIVTAGCSSTPTSSYSRPQAAASSAYQAQKVSDNFGVPVSKVSGKYSGVYYCNNIPVRFTLELKADNSGTLTGSMQRTNLLNKGGPPSNVKTSQSTINGQYDEAASTLRFRMLTMNNQPHNAYYHRLSMLQGVLLPDASAFVLYDTYHTGQTCSAWIAQRGDSFPDDWAFLKKEAEPNKRPGFFDRFGIKRERSKDREKNSCDPKLSGWLKTSEQIPLQQQQLQNHFIRSLYRDKYFVPHFGKPFLQLDTAERMIYNIRLTGSCSRHFRKQQNRSRKAVVNKGYVIQSFANQSSIADVDKAISLLGFDLTDNWLRLGKAHFAHLREHQGSPDTGKAFLASSQFILTRMLTNEQTEYVSYANAQIKQMILPWLTRRLDNELAELSASFTALNHLASFDARSLKSYPQVDTNALQNVTSKAHRKINELAPAAAKQYAQQAQHMDGIRSLAGWQQQFPHLTGVLNTNNKSQIATLFTHRRTQIAAEILRDEIQAFQQAVLQQGKTTAALSAGVRYEATFKAQYSSLENETGFANFARDRRTARNKTLAAATAPMVKLIQQTKHQRTFEELQSNYLMASDASLPAAKKIFTAVNMQRTKVAPFGQGKFETYLNSLYTYDYDRLRELDRSSAAPIAASMRSLMPVMQGVGTLVEAFTGGVVPAKKMLEAEQKKLEQASLIYPTMAFYILNYEKYNRQCIDRDAVTMTVKYRWTEYEVNGGFRHEVDSGGHDTDYKVNQRFLPAFNVIYKNDGDDIMAKFADRFFSGNSKIYRDELIDGTYALMQKNCKGKTIKHIEPNMIRYFNDVKNRQDAITREIYR